MYKFLIIALLATSQVFASQCDDKFPNKQEVVVQNTKVLCNTFYVTVYDELHNAALFSSEVYHPKTAKVIRSNDFHSDLRVKNSPAPEDYIGTGYDRGHLVPAADSTNDTEMSDTFLMTNMTPQLPSVNRVSWNELEMSVRNNFTYSYVITGAIYKYPAKTIGIHKVPVPVSYYKIIYSGNNTKVFEADNVPNAKVVESTLAMVKAKSGINFK